MSLQHWKKHEWFDPTGTLSTYVSVHGIPFFERKDVDALNQGCRRDHFDAQRDVAVLMLLGAVVAVDFPSSVY